MKYLLMLSFTLVLLNVQSCKKQTQELNLNGTFELSSVHLGFSGKIVTYPIGNGNIIKIEGRSYSKIENGIVVKKGIFEIKPGISILSKQPGYIIEFDKETSMNTFVTLADGVLSFAPDVYDGGGSSYNKIQ